MNTEIFPPDDINHVLDLFRENAGIITTNKGIKYYNVPCAFDIETSSFYGNGEKISIMYEWTLGLNDLIIIGRTWQEFIKVYQTIVQVLELEEKKRLRIYVHNLSFEFQFLMFRLNWERVFAIESRKPIEAITTDFVEFRCSYLLSGYGLDYLSNMLQKYKARKMSGDLDYSLIRHSGTPMTSKELNYCVQDVVVVMNYIREKIEENHNNISYLTLTKTGVVRNYCRKACFNDKDDKYQRKYKKYHTLMNHLIVDAAEYRQLKKAFQGGFTHANAWYSGKTVYNVKSRDFCSSYPAVMVADKFPMSRAELIEVTDKEQFEFNLMNYCCMFDVKITGLESRVLFEHPLSFSRCWNVKGYTVDNGRIESAESLYTTLTEQDYFIMEKFYSWKGFEISNFRRYERGYLPTDFVAAILKLYKDKTELKGVEGKEREYLNSKEMVNACYGMTVTDIVRDNDTFNGTEWVTETADVEESIKYYNESKKRFLFFPWGVWVTAHARKRLFEGIYECGNDYIYSDTDSIKYINPEKHEPFFRMYNEAVTKQIKRALQFHVLPSELAEPSTKTGKKKPLGIFEKEPDIQVFKTLGAKRYLYLSDYQLHLTISGVNKKNGCDYMIQKWGKYGAFKAFTDELYFPPEYSGKKTHTYIDEEMKGTVIDYMGNVQEYDELSGVHLEAADYSLSLTDAYIAYLLNIKEVYEN